MDQRAPPTLELPQRLELGPKKCSGSAREEARYQLSSTAAVQTLARIIRPCYGPCGRQKFLVTVSGETLCTGYAAAILRALQLEHPVALFLRDAAQAQAEGSGDGTAFLVLLTEALLEQAEDLLKAGLPRAQLREAYATASAEVLASLPSLAIRSLGPLEDPSWALYSVMNTHTVSHIEFLTKLVAHACWASKELDGSFKPERVGVCVLHGGALEDSCLVPGLAISGKPCGQMTVLLTGARVALFICPFGPASPNAPATARLSSSEDLVNFSDGSERLIQEQVSQLAAVGINVVVVWGEIDDRTLTTADKYGIMVIQATSRREMVYLSEVLDTPLQTRLIPPLKPGKCQKVYRQELGEGLAAVFEWDSPGTPALTLVLRGATTEGLQGAQQAAYHGIDAYFQLCQDPRLIPGAGATEMALAKMLTDKGRHLEGPSGPVFLAFAQALRSLPKTLAENAGLAVSDVMAKMSGVHQVGNFLIGVGTEGIINVAQEGIWDSLMAKAQGLRAVAEVVLQLVTVDQIVMAKHSPTQQRSSDSDTKTPKERLSSMQKKNP
ncbi:T-complex protein 1 subunit theta-like 2 [Ochotona curzoniae]|uniref:T-complex protein 1 subunit theta-like 2 n=1 Tax=Ochotona curzoniae TaxID=130825 RepID=UPI001B347035|nr:T-complex protein 1 subunit theta-like 2 [Ochotona curzoniae]